MTGALHRAFVGSLVACLSATNAESFTLEIPKAAELTREVLVESGARAVPIAPAQDGVTPTALAQGEITIQAYRIPGFPRPADLMAPLSETLVAEGFETLLACETQSCGGFDFRFSLRLIPPPSMFVDLSDYLFLSAVSPDGESYVSAVSSRSASDGYLHIARIVPRGSEGIYTVPSAVAPPSQRQSARSLAARLEEAGRVVLEDLIFDSGSMTLPDEDYPSLTELAAYLKDNPERTVALVGHTDASGPLDVNMSISQRRAEVARAKLIERYDVSQAQVTAEGMGYLAPRSTNLTQAGRDLNRRVEAVLTSTDP